MRFKEFIAEGTTGTLNIFDIDETLLKTTAQVLVVKDGEIIKHLSNRDYNSYQLGAGEKYDFSEFRSAKKFHDESIPIHRMMLKARIILKNSEKNSDSKVIIITARPDFDDKEKFLATFIKHDLDINKIYVERAGNIAIGNPDVKKAGIIHRYLSTEQFTKVRLFDDAMANLKAFLNLQHEFPEIKFEAYLADHEGRIKTIK